MSDLVLWSIDRKFGLSMKKSIIQDAVKECIAVNSQETGGILVGYYTPGHDCAIVTAMSGPTKDSIHKPRSFHRGTHGIQEWIQWLWREKKQYYLGEWHFHPGGLPVPSENDIEQMREFSQDRKLKCPEPILLIIGGDPQGAWTINAFVYPVGQAFVHLLQS